ncbi:hypothetical protein [Kocuria salsicia]|uniref:hypothetical protein n=1 Tax=Kocuria salsicia TaxID=664639 RepID=UPI00119D774C|nr:hypothetical protein [Kocuria salsicia]
MRLQPVSPDPLTDRTAHARFAARFEDLVLLGQVQVRGGLAQQVIRLLGERHHDPRPLLWVVFTVPGAPVQA